MGPSGSEAVYGGRAPERSEPRARVTSAEFAELDTLRRRAYGPDADIFAHGEALARLHDLEDRVRQDRFPPAPDAPAPGETRAAASLVGEDAAVTSVSPARTPRWHGALIAATAAVAVLLGGGAWSVEREAGAAGTAEFVSASNDELDARYRENYRVYMDRLRDEVLSLPGSEDVAERMMRDQLRPYGILYGRTVGVGPTRDHRFCMIIADLPQSSITCIPIEDPYPNPVSVVLPSWYSDADSDVFTGLGELVAYTLMPGGGVVAELADSAAVGESAPFPPAGTIEPAPTPTAVPPPGWQ